jgi:hypothetical protein
VQESHLRPASLSDGEWALLAWSQQFLIASQDPSEDPMCSEAVAQPCPAAAMLEMGQQPSSPGRAEEGPTGLVEPTEVSVTPGGSWQLAG